MVTTFDSMSRAGKRLEIALRIYEARIRAGKTNTSTLGVYAAQDLVKEADRLIDAAEE